MRERARAGAGERVGVLGYKERGLGARRAGRGALGGYFAMFGGEERGKSGKAAGIWG